jgi:hypothetical protein
LRHYTTPTYLNQQDTGSRTARPEGNHIAVMLTLRQLKWGKISYPDLPDRGLRFKESGDTSASYTEYCIKR